MKHALRSPDKRMAKVLVEVDVHVGLLEVLEIEWRGLLFVQRLDYLGLPFRCTVCRRTGHLRKECPNIFGSLVEEDSSDDMPGDSVTPLEEAQDPVDYPGLSSEDSLVASDHTFIGKLKYYFPKLYFSLTAWEREHLNSILFLEQSLPPVLDKGKTLDTKPEITVFG
jgi:hypothetical protein